MDHELLRKMADPDDYSWVKVKSWDESKLRMQNYLDHYSSLMNHHLEEVEFLRHTISELARELLACRFPTEPRVESR